MDDDNWIERSFNINSFGRETVDKWRTELLQIIVSWEELDSQNTREYLVSKYKVDLVLKKTLTGAEDSMHSS